MRQSYSTHKPIHDDISPVHAAFSEDTFQEDKEHEECGVARLLGVKDAGALGALASCPDRGQETAGIAATHIFPRARGRSQPRRNPHPAGAFGHSCNFTAGASNTAHAQPLPVWYSSGLITLAHNCNLSNGKELTETLLHGGPVLQTTTDSELFLHLFAQVEQSDSDEDNARVLKRACAAFSVAMLYPNKLFAVRPLGCRPLVLGSLGKGFAIDSENCAFNQKGATLEPEIAPGEMLTIT